MAVISHNPLPYEVKACMALLLERSLCQRFRCCVSTLGRLVMTAFANPDPSELPLHTIEALPDWFSSSPHRPHDY